MSGPLVMTILPDMPRPPRMYAHAAGMSSQGKVLMGWIGPMCPCSTSLNTRLKTLAICTLGATFVCTSSKIKGVGVLGLGATHPLIISSVTCL